MHNCIGTTLEQKTLSRSRPNRREFLRRTVTLTGNHNSDKTLLARAAACLPTHFDFIYRLFTLALFLDGKQFFNINTKSLSARRLHRVNIFENATRPNFGLRRSIKASTYLIKHMNWQKYFTIKTNIKSRSPYDNAIATNDNAD